MVLFMRVTDGTQDLRLNIDAETDLSFVQVEVSNWKQKESAPSYYHGLNSEPCKLESCMYLGPRLHLPLRRQ
jgi:hypothetical protein